MARHTLFSLIIVIYLLENKLLSYAQRRGSDTTTSTYDDRWSTTATTTTFRSATVRSTTTTSYDEIVHFINNGGSAGLTTPRRQTSSTRRPLPNVDYILGDSSSARPTWVVETTRTTTRPWSNNNGARTTTRRSIYAPTTNDRVDDFLVAAPSVNFTATDSKSNRFNVRWNVSTNEGTLGIKNLRQLALTFTCNATYPVEWLSQTKFKAEDKWEVDEVRHFEEIPRRSTEQSWLPSPIPTFTTVVTYTATLKLTFEKSETVPNNMELNCARARRSSPRGAPKKQTVVEVLKDKNDSIHLRVSKDVQIWPKGNPGEAMQQPQRRDTLGLNENCVVKLSWQSTWGRFECSSEQAANLTFDYTDKDCYDFASCEKKFSENSCWDVSNNRKTSFKSPSDIWNSQSPPAAGVVYCSRDEDKERLNRADALQFFHSLPPICPNDDVSTRHNLHIAADVPIGKEILGRDFMSFCWTPRSYNESMKDDISPLVVYAGENVTVTCVASLYHFAIGTRIGIRFNDGHQYAKVTEIMTQVDRNQGCFNFTAKVHIKSVDVSGLICENYLKQSPDSVQKHIPLVVRAPKNITFKRALIELASWNYTGQPGFQLRCEAEGVPEPKIFWKRAGRPIPAQIEVVPLGPSASILKFPSQRESRTPFSVRDFHGAYTCEAENGLDMSSLTFYVASPNSNAIPVVIDASNSMPDSSNGSSLWYLWVILPLLAVAVLAVIGFLVWKIKKQGKELRLLSKAEVDEFLFGKPEFLQHHSSSEEVNNYAPFLPYNKGYEINKEQLEIDENAVLGSGAYAIVLRGVLTRKGGDKVRVAIKTARAMDDISLFKALLSELKIMGFIGTHPNIVNLVGAHTKNIQNREIFICIEYCENGNLLAYLRDHRNSIRNLVNQNGDYEIVSGGLDIVSRDSFVNPEKGMNTVTLIKWAYEIATGMEFLSQKKVIHGDLAARNILLNQHLIAKIGDFGLSRQLFEYANYIKKQQSPLPWKWLAIECLQDMRFSVKSDVWAFAILLFEIFSLGQVPYPGHSYNDEFLEALINGKRPNRPSHATNAIYSFMATCWKDKAEDRPNFTQIRDFFNKLLSTLVPQEYLDLHEKVTPVVPNPTDIHQDSTQSPNGSNLTTHGTESFVADSKPSRFSFNINTKTITAVFHRN